ncbi:MULTISPECIES: DNA repair protein RecO [unclassified Wenzhouxiangella]|uniref:DNA repair protein RecO n=1 Tax=unclassified Wenzhouxiangella TaxID=2613841 RepID=UPI000E328D88|nr:MULTISPECIES: DNA repair protein RecO [unclassified Wenzhouxiangella]RFF26404.1 DNA repair protein RecO [Wenzhouxiangella sp. 15181]RFP67323.1 DNA repair protein RecO [Wenzhouxiangella sp. 15190]
MPRVEEQPGWVVHRRPWRESSLLIEFFAREYGRVGLVAKGARSARSAWRGLAEPFVPLAASWSRRGEMGTLTSLDTTGPRYRLTGRALWCGLYVNELLLRLLERDDPHPRLFDACDVVLSGLASGEVPQSLLLRRFELVLLRDMGVAPDFHSDAEGTVIEPDGLYHLQPEAGFVPVDRPGGAVFSGAAIRALEAGTTDERETAREMRELMRQLIDHHLAGRELASRRLLAGAATGRTGGSES